MIHKWVNNYLHHDRHVTNVSLERHLCNAVHLPSTADHDATTVRHSSLTTLNTYTHTYTHTHITICAVAQHCYNGDVSFLWEKWKL